jgi:hypothetical protein
VETKQPEQPARSNEPEPSPAAVQEPKVPDAETRRAQVAHDENQPIEEPGYGHGV